MVLNVQGEEEYWSVVITVLNSELEERQAQLEEAAEAANNAKTSFQFNMSHDIRTPMNAIMGFRLELDETAWSAEQFCDTMI